MTTPVEPSSGDPDSAPSLPAMLRDVYVELRPDLDVSRHVFRGEPAYILQDPITFESHRFTAEDYKILCNLKISRALGITFRLLVQRGQVDEADEERFYKFVYSLHKLGFLKLPISDDQSLYARHLARRRAKRRQALTSVLFCRIPLINPDRFLTRTLRHLRLIFTRGAFAIWLGFLSVAQLLLVRNWGEFTEPLADVFSGGNLLLLWGTLIALKIAHEFGHGYACKHFGGHVPEMGAYLIVFTPCAYVDATATWGFSRKRDRILVCLAGMYVELAIASVALILWSLTPPGLLRSILHNIVLLASIVTLAFNLNPLMRYDGYYALSDMVEVPNLRQHAYAECTRLLKRWTLGLVDPAPHSRWHGLCLVGFGISSAIYKVLLVLGISVMIASKFLLLGLLIGGLYVAGELVRVFRAVVPFLFFSEEVSPVRARAAIVGLLLLVGLPFAVMGIPLPSQILAPGVVAAEHESVLRSETDGFLRSVPVRPGQPVQAGSLVAELDDPSARVAIDEVQARLDVSSILYDTHRLSDPAEASKDAHQIRSLEEELRFRKQRIADLLVRSDTPGTIVACIPPTDLGRFVRRGESIATISRGRIVARVLLTAEDMASARPEVGQAVEFRTMHAPDRVLSGTIQNIAAAGTGEPPEVFREHLTMAQLSLNPVTGRASRNLFEIVVTLEGMPNAASLRGMTGHLRLVGHSESLGRTLFRKLLTFIDRVSG